MHEEGLPNANQQTRLVYFTTPCELETLSFCFNSFNKEVKNYDNGLPLCEESSLSSTEGFSLDVDLFLEIFTPAPICFP